MRSQLAYRHAMDRVFDEGSTCWEKNYRAHDYVDASHCYDAWDLWNARNQIPEEGFNWPWAVWKAQTEDK